MVLSYLQSHGDLLSRPIMGIVGVAIWILGVISILTKSA